MQQAPYSHSQQPHAVASRPKYREPTEAEKVAERVKHKKDVIVNTNLLIWTVLPHSEVRWMFKKHGLLQLDLVFKLLCLEPPRLVRFNDSLFFTRLFSPNTLGSFGSHSEYFSFCTVLFEIH